LVCVFRRFQVRDFRFEAVKQGLFSSQQGLRVRAQRLVSRQRRVYGRLIIKAYRLCSECQGFGVIAFDKGISFRLRAYYSYGSGTRFAGICD
jgi:hypothetical protein